MRILYNIGIRIYYLLALVLSIWKPKAAKWIAGRKGWRKDLQDKFDRDEKVIWFHCASLGEFEQGRPLIEKLRETHPGSKILLTFFSPSGYEKRKDFKYVDYVSYLPLDTRKNAKDFLALIPVHKAIFVKYEFWYHFLRRLKKEKIPIYLVSGNFRKDQLFFKWYGTWYRKLLKVYTHIFLQNELSLNLLKGINLQEISIAGDTRFDRVILIAESENPWNSLVEFSGGIPVLVAGSTWEADDKIIREIYGEFKGTIRMILAPHEPDKKSIERLNSYFPENILYSDLNENDNPGPKVIIVDTIGHLSSLYKYGDFAFIGGGFGKGIHNILEATAAGLPVIFGPSYKNFQEARDLVELGGAISIHNSEEAIKTVKGLLMKEKELKNLKNLVRNYTYDRKGATDIILKDIF